jgi:hypothetical protein
MRVRPLAFAAAAGLVWIAGIATAAEWGTIVPGQSTKGNITARFGAATRTERATVDGYQTAQWSYEGAQAPPGIRRLVVEFGLLTPAGYREDLVRSFRLEPKPTVFNRTIVLNGWGPPARVGREGDSEIFLYQEGLLVYFDRDGWEAQLMVFTVPQPALPDPTR